MHTILFRFKLFSQVFQPNRLPAVTFSIVPLDICFWLDEFKAYWIELTSRVTRRTCPIVSCSHVSWSNLTGPTGTFLTGVTWDVEATGTGVTGVATGLGWGVGCGLGLEEIGWGVTGVGEGDGPGEVEEPPSLANLFSRTYWLWDWVQFRQ